VGEDAFNLGLTGVTGLTFPLCLCLCLSLSLFLSSFLSWGLTALLGLAVNSWPKQSCLSLPSSWATMSPCHRGSTWTASGTCI
jgi:hypothetical protein